MHNDNMGDLIAELRKQQNMTQKDLADKLNVTDKAVSKWERGISCPDIYTIPKLAELLKISSEELLSLKWNTTPETVKKDEAYPGQKVKRISTLAFKAVGMAMGVAVLVLSILGSIQTDSAITMIDNMK